MDDKTEINDDNIIISKNNNNKDNETKSIGNGITIKVYNDNDNIKNNAILGQKNEKKNILKNEKSEKIMLSDIYKPEETHIQETDKKIKKETDYEVKNWKMIK